MRLTLLGEKLSHSLSPKIHQLIFDKTGKTGTYDLSEVKKENLAEFITAFKTGAFDGINVTIPYKRDVIPYLDALSDGAKKIGAVNTIARNGNKLTGYNTDYDGFGVLLKANFIAVNGEAFTVLGAGGAAKAVLAYLDDHGAQAITLVSRDADQAKKRFDANDYRCGVNIIAYDKMNLENQVLVNTTPIGMSPKTGISPIDADQLAGCKSVVDIVYNPETTQLMQDAENHAIQAVNGLYMLAAQAVRAQEIWQAKSIPDHLTRYIARQLSTNNPNLVLIGMPGCGKTTIGQVLSSKMKMPLFDIDVAIAEKYGPIPNLFDIGEAHFRAIETETTKKAAGLENTIICTGGGIIKNKANMTALAKNGTIVFIDRPVAHILSDIDHDSRPLLNGKADSLTKLYDERIDLYKSYAHLTVDGSGTIDAVADAVERAWNGA